MFWIIYTFLLRLNTESEEKEPLMRSLSVSPCFMSCCKWCSKNSHFFMWASHSMKLPGVCIYIYIYIYHFIYIHIIFICFLWLLSSSALENFLAFEIYIYISQKKCFLKTWICTKNVFHFSFSFFFLKLAIIIIITKKQIKKIIYLNKVEKQKVWSP